MWVRQGRTGRRDLRIASPPGLGHTLNPVHGGGVSRPKRQIPAGARRRRGMPDARTFSAMGDHIRCSRIPHQSRRGTGSSSV